MDPAFVAMLSLQYPEVLVYRAYFLESVAGKSRWRKEMDQARNFNAILEWTNAADTANRLAFTRFHIAQTTPVFGIWNIVAANRLQMAD